MNAWIFYLHLRSPLLITGVGGGDPNSEVGFSYIPGSSIRGALIGRYGGVKDATDEDFRRLFLDGRVRYLNAYPTLQGRRMLPTPLSLHQVKDADASDPIRDFALYSGENDDKPWKSLKKEYCWFEASGNNMHNVYLTQPERQVNIHIARESRQRPTSGDSTVFRYDSLASGQTFCAVVLAEREEDLRTLGKLIPHGARLSMGRSHSAEYGQVEARWSIAGDKAPEQDIQTMEGGWREAPGGEVTNGRLVVTLLSDALVRDPQTGAYVESLAPILGKEPASAAYVRTRTMGGFNRKWNLPLPQATAMAAGSVFVYDEDPTLRDELDKLTVTGLGQRTTEGFGRIAVNWQSAAELRSKDLVTNAPDLAVDLSGESLALAERMVQRMLRQQLDQKLLAEVNSCDLSGMGPVQKNQLASLRTIVRQDLRRAVQARLRGADIQKNELKDLKEYLGELRKAGRDQLQRARLNKQPFLSWLEKLADKPRKTIRPLLNYDDDAAPAIGAAKAQMTVADEIEYSARLIDAVCRRAVKEKQNV